MSGSRAEPITAEEFGQASAQVHRSNAEGWLFRALILLVALAPLPLASNRPLPTALLALAAGLLLVAWGLHAAVSGRRAPVAPARLRWPLLLYGAVCLWVFVQWQPAGWGDPIWAEASATLGVPLAARISVNPEATLSGLMRLLAYGGVFWLTLQLTRDRERARTAITAAAAIGAAYSLYGIIVYLAGNEWVLIYRKWASHDSLTSTFVNRNSFATFAGLCLLCAFCVLLDRLRHLIVLDRPWRIKAALIMEELLGRSALLAFSALVIAIALMLTASRAGIASSLLALAVFGVLWLRGRPLRPAAILLIAGLAGGIFLLAYSTSGERLATRSTAQDIGASAAHRSQVYAMTIDAINSSPWTGTGLGTFADAFPAYKGEVLDPALHWDKTHNTFLENAFELGIPAAMALNLALLMLAWRTMRGAIERRREKALPALGLSATILAGLHSLVDFSLQIPAVTLLYTLILAVSVSQSWRSGEAG